MAFVVYVWNCPKWQEPMFPGGALHQQIRVLLYLLLLLLHQEGRKNAQEGRKNEREKERGSRRNAHNSHRAFHRGTRHESTKHNPRTRTHNIHRPQHRDSNRHSTTIHRLATFHPAPCSYSNDTASSFCCRNDQGRRCNCRPAFHGSDNSA